MSSAKRWPFCLGLGVVTGIKLSSYGLSQWVLLWCCQIEGVTSWISTGRTTTRVVLALRIKLGVVLKYKFNLQNEKRKKYQNYAPNGLFIHPLILVVMSEWVNRSVRLCVYVCAPETSVTLWGHTEVSPTFPDSFSKASRKIFYPNLTSLKFDLKA